MIVQNIVSLLYLKNFGQWTDDRREALAFPTVSKARRFYQQHQVSMNLAVLVDGEKKPVRSRSRT